jgi:hypothetical protein
MVKQQLYLTALAMTHSSVRLPSYLYRLIVQYRAAVAKVKHSIPDYPEL